MLLKMVAYLCLFAVRLCVCLYVCVCVCVCVCVAHVSVILTGERVRDVCVEDEHVSTLVVRSTVLEKLYVESKGKVNASLFKLIVSICVLF